MRPGGGGSDPPILPKRRDLWTNPPPSSFPSDPWRGGGGRTRGRWRGDDVGNESTTQRFSSPPVPFSPQFYSPHRSFGLRQFCATIDLVLVFVPEPRPTKTEGMYNNLRHHRYPHLPKHRGACLGRWGLLFRRGLNKKTIVNHSTPTEVSKHRRVCLSYVTKWVLAQGGGMSGKGLFTFWFPSLSLSKPLRLFPRIAFVVIPLPALQRWV